MERGSAPLPPAAIRSGLAHVGHKTGVRQFAWASVVPRTTDS